MTYRFAVGPHQSQKVFTLQTVPACTGESVGGLKRYTASSIESGN